MNTTMEGKPELEEKILAVMEFMDWTLDGDTWGLVTEDKREFLVSCAYIDENTKYHSDYNWLMSAWAKFRDLQFGDGLNGIHEVVHYGYMEDIKIAIMHKSISEAFNELAKGVIWYQNLKK